MDSSLNEPEKVRQKISLLDFPARPFIGGQFVEPLSKEVITKSSPADHTRILKMSACNANDIDHAVRAAMQAHQSRIWADKTAEERSAILLELANLMEEHLEELALLDTAETGRCLHNYYYDSVPKAIKAIRWFAEAANKIYDHAIPMRPTSFATVTREPLGVVGIITPWNDPLVVSSWKFSPALLMGNSIVIKPAEQSSCSILRVAELSKQAGIPDGVFNVIPGYGEIAGKALSLHPGVRGVFFTGSSEVGKLILQYAGQSNMKKISLECGGKSAFIISRKCGRLPKAAKVLAKNMFYHQGQICSAPSRLLIHQDVQADFITLLKKECKQYIPADPLDINTQVGCVISQEQKCRIEKFIELGMLSGARKIDLGFDKCAGENAPDLGVLPVIFDCVPPESDLARQEIFGPVLCVIKVHSLTHAIQIANATPFGLAASIWTDDLDEAYQAARLLEAGIVHVNSYGEDDNTVPFGGFKESGFGKDKSLYAFDNYSNIKTTWMSFQRLEHTGNKVR